MSLTDNPDGPNAAVTGGAMPAADLSQTAMSNVIETGEASLKRVLPLVNMGNIDTSQQEAPPPDHAPPSELPPDPYQAPEPDAGSLTPPDNTPRWDSHQQKHVTPPA